MNAPRTRVGVLRGMGGMGICSPLEACANRIVDGVSSEKWGSEFLVGGDQCNEKWRVFVGLILMFSSGSAVCRRLMAF